MIKIIKKIFIHDVVSGLKGKKSWKGQRTKNCKLFQRKNKIEKYARYGKFRTKLSCLMQVCLY